MFNAMIQLHVHIIQLDRTDILYR